jgi:hypothetical protein
MLKASLVESDMALTDAQTELLLNETFAQVRYTRTLHAHATRTHYTRTVNT